MEKSTISLANTMEGKQNQLDKNKLYLIDFSKLNSVNDLVLILAAMSIAFPGDHPHIEALRPFLNIENAMDIPGRVTKPQPTEFNLPKLKQVK
jgi:hypothetical protein